MRTLDMPRIIAGRAGGIPLAAPKGLDTRPTADKTKEALFSILSARIPNCAFLDLFAGTGQVGLEAASRGARQVILVEQAKASLVVIAANLAKTRLDDVTTIQRGSASTVVRQLLAKGLKFDVIFMDPPYKEAVEDLAKLAPDLLDLLEPEGLVILEHDARSTPPDNVTELKRTRSCQYGTAMLSFYQV